MEFEEYICHDGLGLAQLIAERQVTAAEVVVAARAPREVNPRINAIVRWMDADAQARLRRRAAHRSVRRRALPAQGPRPGVRGRAVLLRLPRAGATFPRPSTRPSCSAGSTPALVVFGKTNTPELGAKGITEPDAVRRRAQPVGPGPHARAAPPAGRRPRSPPGIVPVAGASDGGGSIRIPAACCGLFGLKPGRGLIPFGPAAGEPLHGAATNGVHLAQRARQRRDARRPRRPRRDRRPTRRRCLRAPLPRRGRPGPGRLRIGFHTNSAINANPHPSAIAAVNEAAKLLESLGHDGRAGRRALRRRRARARLPATSGSSTPPTRSPRSSGSRAPATTASSSTR